VNSSHPCKRNGNFNGGGQITELYYHIKGQKLPVSLRLGFDETVYRATEHLTLDGELLEVVKLISRHLV
jgi:hypothetical protein